MEAAFYLGHHFAQLQQPARVDLDEMCRLCRNSRGVMSYIYTSSGLEPSPAQRIMNFANIQMSEGDGLPSMICHRCLYHIEKVNEFKLLCEQSDILLRQYLAIQVESERNIASRKKSKKSSGVQCNGFSEEGDYIGEMIVMAQKENNENNLNSSPEVSDDPQCSEEDNEVSIKQEPNTENTFHGIHINGDSNNVVHCPSCNNQFDTSQQLERHSLIHTQEGPFPCDFCDVIENDKASLRIHWKEHAGQKGQICQTCGKVFKSKNSLLTHNLIHDQAKPYHCTVCQKAFSYKSDLRKHLVIHSGIRPYICPICYKSFTRSTNLNKHSRLHTGRRPFACNGCDKMFATRGDLMRHMVIHTGEKPYSCSICSLSFNRKDKLSRHEKLHVGERPHTCQECPTSFGRKEELTKHIQFHHFSPIYDYGSGPQDLSIYGKRSEIKNEDCLDSDGGGDKFEREDVVIDVDPIHWAEDSSGEDCQADESVRKGREGALETEGEGRRFVCQVCWKGFRHKRELVRHTATHTGLRPHPCPTCGKAFARSDKLKRHIRTHLLKLQREAAMVVRTQCDICFKVLSSKHELRRHLITHSMYKPYQCSLCSSSYCRKDKLVKHIRRIHPNSFNA